ncbi:MAG: M15 family metallopeptidase [Nitriliruptorales bacterium]|nr:M15 family metallopeptidase [Nitriliruptorales bacterium]
MRPLLLLIALAFAATACAQGTSSLPADGDGSETPATPSPNVSATEGSEAATEASTPGEPTSAASAPPPWLGTRVLPEGDDGFGAVIDTPPELRDRRLRTTDHLPPPEDRAFQSTVDDVPDEVLERSTWSPDCPVAADELAYVTLTFWGFDELPHTGELLVHRSVAADVVDVFEAAYAARFPIEEMRIVAPYELDLPPTGDGNNTTAFVCRAVRGSQNWSQHAKGLAIDINPFHNPYVKGDLVLPELASAYVDRENVRPGMLREGGPFVTAFREIGWGWGGTWTHPIDWMHFSRDGG